MSSFEYVMVLVSIVVGLALTHVLTALATAVHRLRGHGPPIRMDPVYLPWVGFVLTWLVSFWWWEFRYQEVVEVWSFGLYLFVILYAVTLFLMAVLLVPGEMEGVNDAYDYFFMSIRHWFLGIVLFTQVVIDPLDTVLKGTDWLLQSGVLVLSGIIVVTCVAAWPPGAAPSSSAPRVSPSATSSCTCSGRSASSAGGSWTCCLRAC